MCVKSGVVTDCACDIKTVVIADLPTIPLLVGSPAFYQISRMSLNHGNICYFVRTQRKMALKLYAKFKSGTHGAPM